MEKILKKKISYRGRILNIEEVDIDFGNGKKSVFELINFHVDTGVTILPLDDDNNMYMVKQYKLGVGDKVLTLPSGGLEKGEDPYGCANKELQEEIGFKARDLTLMYRGHTSPGYVGTIPTYFFLAKDLTPSKLEGDEMEEIEVIKLPMDKVLKMIKSGEIVDLKTISAVLYYQQYIK